MKKRLQRSFGPSRSSRISWKRAITSAWSCWSDGELDAAVTCFERVADLKPGLFVNQRRLADALALRGDLHRARGHYQCALVIQPDSERCKAALARVIKELARNHVEAPPAPV